MTAPVAEAPATEEAVDIKAFEDLVTNVISDPANVDPEDVKAARVEYQRHERKGKAAGRKYVEDQAAKAVLDGNLPEAQALLRLKDEILKPITTGKPRQKKVKPTSTEDVVDLIAALQIGYSLAMIDARAKAEAGEIDADWESRIAEIVDIDAQNRAKVYADFLGTKQDGEEPVTSEVEKSAARVSLGRSPKGQGRKPKLEADQPAAEETVTEVVAEAPTAPAPAPVPGAVTQETVDAFNAHV